MTPKRFLGNCGATPGNAWPTYLANRIKDVVMLKPCVPGTTRATLAVLRDLESHIRKWLAGPAVLKIKPRHALTTVLSIFPS